MSCTQRPCFFYAVFAALMLFGNSVLALEFEPGAGIGVEYTDNVRLSTFTNEVSDTIAIGYVGARLAEEEGPLTYDASTSFNNLNYTQDSYYDQRYFNLSADADWEMIKDRFIWSLSDYYSQRPVDTLTPNTPDNLQDTNAFAFGANIIFPVSARQNFSISPVFSQYYYEIQSTDNKQFSLSANWNYQMYRLTGIGLNLSSRKINYTESDAQGNFIADTTFTNAAFVVTGKRSHSNYSMNLGATKVKREGGAEYTGFAGNLDWLVDLTAHSKFRTFASTDLTDGSSVTLSSAQDPINGNPNDVQITTDVIRNSVFNLAYLREDGSLNSSITADYRKLEYSDSPLDRVVQGFGILLNYPVTQLLSTGVYANYNHVKELDTARVDDNYTIGSNLEYRFSRKWHSLFDVKYRSRDSTDATQNFDELSVFASLVYGFGDVYRPTRVGWY